MTSDEIRRRLSSFGAMDFEAAERLARDIVADTRPPLSSLSALVMSGDDASARKAGTVLDGLAELSILPRLAAAERLDGERRLRLVGEAYRTYRSLEVVVVNALRAALGDRAPVPVPVVPGPVETPPPVTRVCDEAYLLWGRLSHPDEPEAEHQRARLEFARLPEAQRDDAIRKVFEAGLA